MGIRRQLSDTGSDLILTMGVLLANKALEKGYPIRSRRSNFGRHAVCVVRASREERRATTEAVAPLETVSKLAAGILVASLTLCAPDMDQGLMAASAQEYPSQNDELVSNMKRRKELLRAAKEKAMQEVHLYHKAAACCMIALGKWWSQ